MSKSLLKFEFLLLYFESLAQNDSSLVPPTDFEVSSAQDGVQVTFGSAQLGLGLVHERRGAL